VILPWSTASTELEDAEVYAARIIQRCASRAREIVPARENPSVAARSRANAGGRRSPGYAFVPIKVALAEVPPFTLVAVRFARRGADGVFRPAARDALRFVIAYGFAIGVCQFGLLFLGIKLGMPAGLSSVVIQMQVFFTIGLAVVFAGDRVHKHNLVGAAIAAAG
jgi:hypothetical protein